ncbi:hypothetical protein MRX96_035349 [Rhipicephalus microplus]
MTGPESPASDKRGAASLTATRVALRASVCGGVRWSKKSRRQIFQVSRGSRRSVQELSTCENGASWESREAFHGRTIYSGALPARSRERVKSAPRLAPAILLLYRASIFHPLSIGLFLLSSL